MKKKFSPGTLLVIPKNFNLREYRGLWAKVLEVHGERLTLRCGAGPVFTAMAEEISAKRTLNVNDRWDILNRDRFRCRVCGHGTDAQRTLHVDHARSFHAGGTTEDLENLWTLCSLCNLGKGTISIDPINAAPLVSETEVTRALELCRDLRASLKNGDAIDEKDLAELLPIVERAMKELRGPE